ncbi:MAG: hypothetical protein PHU80_10740 [Kiritimatiellae bacterium]|nr:hypothetical protein [Kiritimatiellia bacterium]
MHKQTRHCWAAVLVSFLCATATHLYAADPVSVIQTAAAVKEAAPGLTRAGKGIAEVPRQTAQCLRLPLGLVQMVFSPLPEVTFKDGLKNTGKGLVAPFKLCIAILEMPYEVVCGIGEASGA